MKLTSLSLVVILAMILSACNIGGTTPPDSAALLNVSALTLGIQAQNGNVPFDTVGETINLVYVVTNIGGASLAGPVTVLDTKGTVTCPDVNTVGNLNATLDTNESINCTSGYAITQADLNNGSINRTAIASAGGVSSEQVSVAINMAQTRELSLTVIADPTSYSQLGQTISYSYAIRNTGNVTLGPSQFTVTDDRIGGQINCGPDTTILDPEQTTNCSASYIVSDADMTASAIKSNVTASGGGVGPSQTVTASVNNSKVAGNPNPGSSNITPGSTIQHTVMEGEWLVQIARCYGASYTELRSANPQIANPAYISPHMVITVPRVGSAGKIYGSPCVGTHTVQNNDTWNTIAQKYNADAFVLQIVNPGALSVGRVLKVPLNSAGATNIVSDGTNLPVEGEPIRVTIPDNNTATLTGILTPQGNIRYVVTVNQNQILDIKVTAPAGEVALRVRLQGGVELKPSDTTLSWASAITQTGNYIIELKGVAGANNKNFTIEIKVVPITS